MRLDKEATQRIVKNALGSQLRDDEIKNKAKSKGKNWLSSDSENDDEDEAVSGQMKVGKTDKPAGVSKLP